MVAESARYHVIEACWKSPAVNTLDAMIAINESRHRGVAGQGHVFESHPIARGASF